MDPAYLDAISIEEEERWFSSSIGSNEDGWRMLVAEDDGGLVGFVGFRLEPDDPLAGHIGSLYVAPDRFGSGVGTALLNAASDELRDGGAATGFLWVLEEDSRAISFYEAREWLRDGARLTVDNLDRPRVAVRCTKDFSQRAER